MSGKRAVLEYTSICSSYYRHQTSTAGFCSDAKFFLNYLLHTKLENTMHYIYTCMYFSSD